MQHIIHLERFFEQHDTNTLHRLKIKSLDHL
jgi:hypothetical protein